MLKPKRFAIVAGVTIATVGFIMGGLYLIRQAEEKITVVVPEFSSEGTIGMTAFETYCIECHGKNAAGTDKGPPLVHPIYRPGHHGDFSFVRAVTLGVPQHHWLFGSMPPQPAIRREEIDQIVVYLRELQRANDIY
jgi:mono/diheme cytochrome c family protein